AAFFVGFLLLHAAWADWAGGWSWGPRLLLPSIPGMLNIGSFARKRWLPVLVGLSLLGFALNSPTMVSFYERYYAELSERGIEQTSLFWSPAASPLVQVWGAAAREFNDAANFDVRELVRSAGSGGSTLADTR